MDVRVRQLSESDIPTVHGWLDDPVFRSEFLPFGETWRLIGLLFRYKVPYIDYLETGFYTIPEERGKGYGTEAMRQLVKFVFKNYNAETIVAGTSSLNLPSQRALKKARFEKTGALRKTLLRNGRWEDSIIYQITRK